MVNVSLPPNGCGIPELRCTNLPSTKYGNYLHHRNKRNVSGRHYKSGFRALSLQIARPIHVIL